MFPVDKYRQKPFWHLVHWGSYPDISSRRYWGQVVFLWWQDKTGCVAAVFLAGAAWAHPADDSSLRVAQNITLCLAAFLFLLHWCIWVSPGVGVSFTNLSFPIKERWLPALLYPDVQHSKWVFFWAFPEWLQMTMFYLKAEQPNTLSTLESIFFRV